MGRGPGKPWLGACLIPSGIGDDKAAKTKEMGQDSACFPPLRKTNGDIPAPECLNFVSLAFFLN